MVTVKWSELLDAFEFVSFGAPGEIQAFINLDTGSLHCTADGIELEEELPENFESSDRFLALPHKKDLDLGRNLALSFTEQHLPTELDKVLSCFHKRGAYARFKDLLEHRGLLEDWYIFENDETERALKQWCHENDIEIAPGTAA